RDLTDRDSAATRQALLEQLFSADPGARESAADELVSGGLVESADSYTTVVIRSRRQSSSDASTIRLELEAALRDLVRGSTFQAVGGLIESAGVAVLPGAVDADAVRRMLRRQDDQALIAGIGGAR